MSLILMVINEHVHGWEVNGVFLSLTGNFRLRLISLSALREVKALGVDAGLPPLEFLSLLQLLCLRSPVCFYSS